LGLTMAEGKMTLAGLQRHLVQAQAEEHCRRRRRCDYCGAQRPCCMDRLGGALSSITKNTVPLRRA
jgi:hypothetical protein